MIGWINGAVRHVPVWAVYGALCMPAPWFFFLALTGRLGAEPVEVLEHSYGELALQLLIAGLCVTPLRRYAGLNLMRFRRAIGVMSFVYVALHLVVWLLLDVQILAQVWADIVKRPYVTVGMVGFLLLLPLAATSNDWSVRRLGPQWRRLHRLVYGAALLGALHFVMLGKGFRIEPLIYFLAVVGLLALRLPFSIRPKTIRSSARQG